MDFIIIEFINSFALFWTYKTYFLISKILFKEPQSLHDALVLCIRTLFKAICYGFHHRDKRAEITRAREDTTVMDSKQILGVPRILHLGHSIIYKVVCLQDNILVNWEWERLKHIHFSILWEFRLRFDSQMWIRTVKHNKVSSTENK